MIRMKMRQKKSIIVLPRHMVDDRGEVGGSIKLNWLQTLVVGFHHALNTSTVWILRISVLGRWDSTAGLNICITTRGLKPSSNIPRQTRERSVHQVAAWLQSPEQETFYHCRSPGWFLQPPSEPWRKHSAGRGSCSGGRWAGPGYLDRGRLSVKLLLTTY